MTAVFRRALMIATIAFVAALAGVLLGRQLFVPARDNGAALHDVLHEHLDLTPAQHVELDAMEARFAIQRQALEFELRSENAQLAAAIEAEHGIGPQVNAAIDRSHRTMGALQKATLEHVFAMRALLRPDQAAKFDQAVVKALTDQER